MNNSFCLAFIFVQILLLKHAKLIISENYKYLRKKAFCGAKFFFIDFSNEM
jgi:hypothetical protein